METHRKMFRLSQTSMDYLDRKMVEWGGPDGPMEQSDAMCRIIDEHSGIPGLNGGLVERCIRLSDENARIVVICEQNNIVIRENWC
jgi:hypothetical protein